MKISHTELSKLFAFDVQREYCIEIAFEVMDDREYGHCWMGKMPDADNKNRKLFWFGLASDGKHAYDFDTFEQMYHAPVFNGKSLREILMKVNILSIDACPPEDRLRMYISE